MAVHFVKSWIHFTQKNMWFLIKKQLNKLEFPLHENALCQVWLKLDKLNWRRKSLIVTNQSPSLVEIGQVELKKKIFNCHQSITVFLLFCYYFSLGKDMALSLNLLHPKKKLSKLCEVRLKIVSLVDLEKNIFKF